MNKEQENKMLIKHLQSGIATAKGVDGDFIYITVGDAKRILKAFGVESDEVENGYLKMIIKALECRASGNYRGMNYKNCKHCHYVKRTDVSTGDVLYICQEKQIMTDTINLLIFYADELRKEREKNENT